jgi:hypothetical protein
VVDKIFNRILGW